MRVLLRTGAGQAVAVDGATFAEPRGPFDLLLDVGAGDLRPGLINAHDHLHRNHLPRLGSPPYPNAYAWGRDLHARWPEVLARGAELSRTDALLFGALKNLLGGVTTVVHHDRWTPELGNGFPVRVPRVRVADTLEFEPDLAAAVAGDAGTASAPLCIHLAEGVDRASAEEVRKAARLGLVDDRLIAAHLVGVDAQGIESLRRAHAAVVWCPTSNRFLFGRTAPVELLRSGVAVLLGTDSLVSGDGTLLDELRVAHQLAYLEAAGLERAVGMTVARRLGLAEPGLFAGAAADLVLLRRPLFAARPRDVALVLVAGEPRLCDTEFGALFERHGVPAEPLVVGGVAKLVAAPLATIAHRVFALSPDCRRILD